MPDMLFIVDFQSNALGYMSGQALRLANLEIIDVTLACIISDKCLFSMGNEKCNLG